VLGPLPDCRAIPDWLPIMNERVALPATFKVTAMLPD
jgi:hypothetical protein